MDDLGASLLKTREEKGITYKKVHKDLFLREDQVRLIEDNRFSELGTLGIAQAIVRKYAQYLGVDPELALAEVRGQMQQHSRQQFKPKKPVREKKILLSPNFFWLIGIILFVVLLASIVWYAYGQGWLKTPDIFRKSAADTTLVAEPVPEQPKTDSLRNRMRQLSSTQAKPSAATATATSAAKAAPDSTDYLGELLGPSQVNVPLH